MPGELAPNTEFYQSVVPKNDSGYKDIGVSMREDVLAHKQTDGVWDDGSYCYWTLRNGVPEDIGIGSKLWVASKGAWQGYFVVFHVDPLARDEEDCENGSGELRFYSESWHGFLGGPRKPFQGFTYKVPSGVD